MANGPSGDVERQLHDDHTPERIAHRLGQGSAPQYVSDAVLGGIDGCVTTFAVVCGSVGAGFSSTVALVLGLANLVADGFSMAVSNFQAEKARDDHRESAMRAEREHIEKVPDGEREEVRQIFAAKGFTGSVLEDIVQVITSDRELWLHTMLVEEHGLQSHRANPYRAAFTTFIAFAIGGFLPLTPLLLPFMSWQTQFQFSAVLAGLTFFAVGALRSIAFARPVLRSALSTLVTGGAAAGLAYGAGYLMRQLFHVT